MSKHSPLRSAVSALALASMLGACAQQTPGPRSVSSFRAKNVDVGLATRALAALKSNDLPTAISLAERAVEQTPKDAGFRALLGNAYFASGRFASAEQAFKDSLFLYEAQPQVVLKLALVQIAQGKSAEALAFLDAGRGGLEAADYGLALALAGQTQQAVPLLRHAAETSRDPRVRQNLALAYALDGDWVNARVIAAADIPADQLDERIQSWMQFVGSRNPRVQVAGLVGVTPAGVDAGQPVRLALVTTDNSKMLAQAAPPVPPMPEAVAVAPPPPPLPPVMPAPEYIGAAAPVSVPNADVASPVRVAVAEQGVGEVAVKMPAARPLAAQVPAFTAALDTEAPAEVPPPPPPPFAYVEVKKHFPLAPARKAVASSPKKAPALAAKAPAERPRLRPAALAKGNSAAVLQLGAYSNAAAVERAWTKASARFARLNAYRPMSAAFRGPKGTVYRLSVKGFGSAAEARALCGSIKSSGGKCFVRGQAGDRPVNFAAR